MLAFWAKTFQGSLRSIFLRYPLADRKDSQENAPLFIISAGRSGTTLMRSMLAAGGQIAIPPETQIFPKLPVKYLAFHNLGWVDLCKQIVSEFESSNNFYTWEINTISAYQELINLPPTERSLARIIQIIMMEYAKEKFPHANMWGDQSPINTFYLPYIRKTFPQARYLHLVRDGRDVISSMVKRHGEAYLDEAIFRWNNSIHRIHTFQKKIKLENFIEIRYEDLVQRPQDTLTRVARFINIDYSQEMLEFWKAPSTIEHKYHDFHKNLEKPVFTSSIGAWKERLTPDQQQYIASKISRYLQETGYPV